MLYKPLLWWKSPSASTSWSERRWIDEEDPGACPPPSMDPKELFGIDPLWPDIDDTALGHNGLIDDDPWSA